MDKLIYKQGEFLGDVTNNQAEYGAVLMALRWLYSSVYNASETQVTFVLDSELVVKQILGIYRVKNPNLKAKFLEIKKLIESCKFKVVNFVNVPRVQNSVADDLVNQILNAK